MGLIVVVFVCSRNCYCFKRNSEPYSLCRQHKTAFNIKDIQSNKLTIAQYAVVNPNRRLQARFCYT